MISAALLMILPAASTVDSVLVFADRADVRRVQEVGCDKGHAQAVFDTLPVDADLRTLRGAAKAPAKALGVSSEIVVEEQAQTEEARSLEKAVRALEDEVAALDAKANRLGADVARLNGFDGVLSVVVSEQMRGAKPDKKAWAEASEQIDARRLAQNEELLQVQQQRLTKSRELGPLHRKLAAVSGARLREVRKATVTVTCSGARATVYLGYVVARAGWNPEYDLRFTPTRGEMGPGRVRWSVAAVVRQSTGEDWSQAALRLSTSKPRLGASAPMPQVVWVDARPKASGKVLVEGTEVQRTLQASQPAAASLDDGGNPLELPLPGRVTVKADGRPNWFVVKTYTTKGKASWIAYPKDRAYVYRAVSFVNPAPHALLAAPIHSFFRNAFVGDATTRYRGPGEPMEVSLGIDGRFSLERKILNDKDQGASWLGSTKHVARAYRTILRSTARGRANIEVRENIPVSKVKDVEIELKDKATTKGYTIDKDRGHLSWAVALAPGGEQEVRLGYEIHLPEDWVVPGRR